MKFDARVLRAAKPREILIRMLQNLRSVYQERNDMPRALSAVDRLLLLAPENIRGLRERAQLCEQLGGPAAAAADLEKVLRLEPNASDSSSTEASQPAGFLEKSCRRSTGRPPMRCWSTISSTSFSVTCPYQMPSG